MQSTTQPRKGSANRGKKSVSKRHVRSNTGVKFTIVLTTMFLLLSIGFGAYTYYMLSRDTFYSGITVDGLSLDRLTFPRAMQALNNRKNYRLNDIQIRFVYGEQTWEYDHQSINARYNIEQTLVTAYQVGRTGNIVNKMLEIFQTGRQGKSFETALAYDEKALLSDLEEIAQEIYVETKDATITFHNKKAEQFTFTKEIIGKSVALDKMTEAVKNMIDKWDFYPYVIQIETHQPKVTLEEVKTWTTKLVTHHTVLYGTSERIHNITLSSASFDGVRVDPGEVFSLNEATGPRGLNNGYKNAPVIVQGVKLSDEPGGGNCQTSTTLYGAVLLADLEIIERWHHSWPSTYTKVGQDAMVDYPGADLKIKNNHETPIFISRSMVGDKIIVEIYGKKSDAYDYIDIVTEIISTTDKPAETIVHDPNLYVGQTIIDYASRPGIRSQSYRVYYKDGVEINRVQEAASNYRRIVGKKIVGTKPIPEEDPVAQPDPDATEIVSPVQN